MPAVAGNFCPWVCNDIEAPRFSLQTLFQFNSIHSKRLETAIKPITGKRCKKITIKRKM
jgi:hypothetical protein